LVLVVILVVVVLVVRLPKPGPGSEIAIDPVSIFKSSPLFGIAAIIGFALGFYW